MVRWVASIVLVVAALTAADLGAQSREEANAELAAVRDQIDDLRKELASEGRRLSRAERELAEVEKSEQKARRELAGVRKQLKETRARQQELERQADRQRAAIEEQRRVLAEQLRVAYINGEEEWLRVVLNQQDAARLGQRMTYYSYLSRYRSDAIEQLRVTLEELEETVQEIAQQAQQLVKLEANAADTLESIAETRAERAALLVKINKSIDSKDAQIARLTAQEKDLTELVERLARVLPAMPDVDAAPFSGQTANLPWPADGPVLKNYGQPRAGGELKWKGVLLGAPAGSDVRAVYHGRVVFSDWLDGMGLLTIIEHDDGYMSLYGYNQSLLKEVGEWVQPGDPIAYVGDSGGQSSAGLYFEIRKNGTPVNPAKWLGSLK